MGELKGTMKERYAALRMKQVEGDNPVLTWQEMEQQRIDRKKRNKDFDAKHVMPRGSRPVCVYCRKELRLFMFRAYDTHTNKNRVYGDYGDNLFCGLRCAHSYAVTVAGNVFGKNRGIR